jgi:hypothetical protein
MKVCALLIAGMARDTTRSKVGEFRTLDFDATYRPLAGCIKDGLTFGEVAAVLKLD